MPTISIEQIKNLRVRTGVSIKEVKNALKESGGDEEKAIDILRKKGALKAAKKESRETKQGVIDSYIHSNQRVGVLLEIFCETDFVAKNEEFKKLVHEIAMHIAAMDPLYAKPEDIPEKFLMKERKIYEEQFKDSGKSKDVLRKIIDGKIKNYSEEVSLLKQPFIKDQNKTVEVLINEHIMKLGENIKLGRFVRYQI